MSDKGSQVGWGANQYKSSDHKAVVTLAVIMGKFLWVPFMTISIVTAFCPTYIQPIVFINFTWIDWLSQLYGQSNIIYPIFNKEFCCSFKLLLTLPKCMHEGPCHNQYVYSTSIMTKVQCQQKSIEQLPLFAKAIHFHLWMTLWLPYDK